MINLPENTSVIENETLSFFLARDEWLMCLEDAGVDKWSGFNKALSLYTGIPLEDAEAPVEVPETKEAKKRLSSQYDGLDKKSFEKLTKKELVAILVKLVEEVDFDDIKDETGWPCVSIDQDRVADILRQRVVR